MVLLLVRSSPSSVFWSFHFGDIQHEGPASARGLREALLQQLLPLRQRLPFRDGFLLLLVTPVKAIETPECQMVAAFLPLRHDSWHDAK